MIQAAPGVRGRPGLAELPARRARTLAPPDATLIDREELTPGLLRLTVRPDDRMLEFRAGQYVQLRLPDGPPPRPYSIASRPGSRDVELLIAYVEGGALSGRLFRLPLGARLSLGTPRGLFLLEPGDDREHVLVGTGTGIAPLLSMARELRHRASPPRTTLFHGARIEAELAARSELEELSSGSTWFTYRPTLSRPDGPGWQGLTGRVVPHVADDLQQRRGDPGRLVSYLCGNADMLADCGALLLALGVPSPSIRTERFTPTVEAA
jgi:phenol/toluene 2-monooxygenase (NADH) P5/A5